MLYLLVSTKETIIYVNPIQTILKSKLSYDEIRVKKTDT